jgi:SAM-dependent methyltransferase
MDPAVESPQEESLVLPAAAIFLSAFLLFQVQPVVGKLVLPWFGGSAGVWTTCLLFFQMLLLLGYLYAHVVVHKLDHRGQLLLHGGLLLAALLTLPLRLHEAFRPATGEAPALRLLGLLTVTVGLPYLLLSTTGPLVQAWVARKGKVPYRLFALSNLGSMLALLGYPVLVEPFLRLRFQAWAWSGGFLLFAVLILQVGRRSAHAVHDEAAVDPGPVPGRGLKLLWVWLAAVPSILLMAVTSHLSSNVAPIPFLWVVPLALYLLSFILCFDSDRWYRRWLFLPLLPLVLGGLAALLHPDLRFWAVRGQVALFCAGLFVICMVGHGELARLRPHPRYLTGFYLRISAGGAIGGLLVAVAAPALFRSYLELPLGLVLCAAMILVVLARDGRGLNRWLWRGALFLFAILTGSLGAYAWKIDHTDAEGAVVRDRNFYGTLTVYNRNGGAWRTLSHGTITHGGQFLDAARANNAVTYYGPDSGVGLAIRSLPEGPRKLAIVGLGAGSLAVWGRPGDRVSFYEINPLVERFARGYFSFLRNSRAQVDIRFGDARLTLEREPPQGYDLIAVDAFSSDAIPVHLLTREAFAVYARQLRPGGVLAVHISNRYLDLAPVVRAGAEPLGLHARVVDNDGDEDQEIYASTWVLLCKDEPFFRAEAFLDNADVGRLPARTIPWTDDFSNLFRILK